MKEKILITNCHLVNPFDEVRNSEILIEHERILKIEKSGTIRSTDTLINAGGRLTAPGFIDVHIQGAGGTDVLDGTDEALNVIARTCARFGVTGFLATTIFRPGGFNQHIKTAAACTGKDLKGADLLGIHLEGPFISREKRGMIKNDCIADPDRRILEEILSLSGGSLRMMTVAPEAKGCLDIIRALTQRGVIASFGHSPADYEQTKRGIEAGISHVTHLFNAMGPILHRDPGPIPAIFEKESVTAQLIADGVHIHPSVMSFACELLGDERLVLITDGMQAMGLPDGSYEYNGLRYESRSGTARYLDGTLIGTSLGMSQLVERCFTLTGSSLLTAVRAASYNPARVLGIEKNRGSIEPGKDADIVVLNSDFSVWKTIKRGRIIYEEVKDQIQ